MTPLSSFKFVSFIFILLSALSLVSCGSSGSKCPPCDDSLTVSSKVNLDIVDNATKASLFFGTPAKYNLNQLKLRHFRNGRPDSLVAPVAIDAFRHLIALNVQYHNSADTFLMQIGALKPDTLYMSIGITDNCCPRIYISEASLNSKLVYNTFNGTKTDLVKASIITVPK